MNSNKLKNIFLTLAIISFSMLLVVFPASVTNIYNLNSSYMHKDKKIIEKDFYKNYSFENTVLERIANLLSTSVINIENSTEDYIKNNTFEENNIKIDKDGREVEYKKLTKPSELEAKESIKKEIDFAKNELKSYYSNMTFMVINKEDNSYYTNTKYKTIEDYKKNVNDYLDIEIKKTPEDSYYIKDINNKKSTDKNENISLYESIRQNSEIYISLPNTNKLKYSDIISDMSNNYDNNVKYTETMIILVLVNSIVFLIATISYNILKRKSDKKESKLFEFIKKIPIEMYLLAILIQAIYYIMLSFDSGYYNYSDIYTMIGYLGLAFLVNLVFTSTIYITIKILFSYEEKVDILKNTLIYKAYILIKNNIKMITKSSKNMPLIKRIITISIIFILLIVFQLVITYTTRFWYSPRIILIMSVILPSAYILILAMYIIKKLSYLDYIMESTKKIKDGELDYKIDIIGNDNFTTLAENINNIGDGLEKSIETQLKSERMKSELITNVSHDLKTPLTSIINYIELIKKEDNIQPKHINDYIKVLDSKSKRLKVLIEDLFEASKASSGNIQLNMEKIDMKQLLIQSIGEMEEKLTNSNLDLKLNIPQEKIYIHADGRRMYRVFENLLSNIAKYSLPNTRVYIDITQDNENIKLTMKNISSYELNFDATEITERFKRADESRNTEGSGLGLAIAKDLVKIQGGEFEVDIDGDLFKVNLNFRNKFNI